MFIFIGTVIILFLIYKWKSNNNNIYAQMGKGFASMLFGDCSPMRQPYGFPEIPQEFSYTFFNWRRREEKS